MNSVLAQTIDNYCPKFNKNVVDGTGAQVFATIPEYMDDIIRSSIKSLSPKINFVYKGYRRYTPNEEFNLMYVSETNTPKYDIAESDIYLCEYIFEFNGEEIRKPLYLPYAEDGNLLRMSHTLYHIVPVLSDTVVSPSYDAVFVRLLKDKLSFSSTSKSFIVDGNRVPGKVIHTNIVKTSTMNIKDNIGRPLTSVSLYLLGKYGLKYVLENYGGIKDYMISDQNVDNIRDKYVVYESTKVKPRSLKETVYIGHNLKICIGRNEKISTFLENFIYGLIYSFDILPHEVGDCVSVFHSGNLRDEILYWRILLGRIVYKNSFSVERITEDMVDHFDNLEGYLDNLIKVKLRENRIYAENFFDLLYVIMENYNTWLINSKEYNSDIRNRYIDILYYIMYEVIVGFNKVILNLNKRVGKKTQIHSREVRKILLNELQTKKIFSICKASSQSLALLGVDSSLDIKYPKITAILEDQSRGSGVKRNSKAQFPISTQTLKGHDIALGNMLFLNKSAPTPRLRCNPYLNYDVASGRIYIPDDIEPVVSKLDLMLSGRLENDNVEIFETENIGKGDK